VFTSYDTLYNNFSISLSHKRSNYW
jgi:hypothetical protein